jgi:hypothetical protein
MEPSDSFLCPICFENYDCPEDEQMSRIPVVARCGHTLCRLCSIELGNRSATTGPQCPICRSSFVLPLPNNFLSISLLKSSKKKEKKEFIDVKHLQVLLENLFPGIKEWNSSLTTREKWLLVSVHVLLFCLVKEYRQFWLLISHTILSLLSMISQILSFLLFISLPFINFIGAMYVTPLLVLATVHSLLHYRSQLIQKAEDVLKMLGLAKFGRYWSAGRKGA